MITCHVRYVIDPKKIVEFERYARMWIPLVEQFGGQHHGYFLPSEGANNIALALFSFPSLADYEKYRLESVNDEACQAAFKYAEQTDCVLSYERSFFRPILSSDTQ
ncbi:NIPSNAP family protein [Vibrio diazotrophicus]|uniref:NIPSNAP family protein n=1 Tax=Vibrio diazotrophicus TaxID=685 RepID=A0A329EG51_VIBDI|nr:NIPSNAP family protein [Vibrio diazotrophicus]PNI03691.1 NIPSNAP family protein [Vibrio diazotrophicus]RAS69549.1 NIPSNAP protein [Vibrio diazotrophicus]